MDIDLELGLGGLNSAHDEEVTADEVLRTMEEIWMNEKFAPELLPHNIEAVDCLYLQIDEMEKNIASLERSDIRRCLHELELVRIRYLLSSYLRTRLMKIEMYADIILQEEEARRNDGEELYLTTAETTFAETFKNLSKKYIMDIIPGLANDDAKEDPVKPNINSFVFFQSRKKLDGVIVDDGVNNDDVVDIKDGSKMIMTYSSIQHYLKNGEVRLI